MNKRKKGKGISFTTVLLILAFLAGLSLLLYPAVSDYINSMHQSKVITSYSEFVATIDDEEYEKILQDAIEYNKDIKKRKNTFILEDEELKRYNELLNVSGNGLMGYIEIPSIKCTLPIYHGTSNTVLQTAIGHLEWTSLPTGGESTHCVVSGHRGLPSAKLFSNLDQLSEGDIFMMRVLDEVMTYQVDQILIVEPDQIESLQVVEGKDYCTLFTCTPYGINTHRMCVRGHRIENIEEAKTVHITSEAIQIEPLIVAPIVAFPILLLVFIIIMMRPKRKEE
ncbi:MAG: class C sortase [Clostridia bacterium]|nr:class C sortase [Clostridia bacterium]